MLSKVKAYSQLAGLATLTPDPAGSEYTDFIRIRSITGLDPVKATINTSQFVSVPGGVFSGSNIPSRNVVLTLKPNPDWVTWTVESLRKLIYLYFPSGSPVQLVFEDDVKPPVTIFGYVEDCSVNPFVKDVELQVSIICPDPYFSSLNPIVVTGRTVNAYSPANVTYNGEIPAGVILEIDDHSGEADATRLQIQTMDPATGVFIVDGTVNPEQKFIMSSLPGNKYVDTVRLTTGVVVGLLGKIEDGYSWPTLSPGSNPVSIITDAGSHDWTLTYYERFGGL